MESPLTSAFWKRLSIRYAILLVATGLLLNTFVERHSFLRLGIQSVPFDFGWGDLVFSVLAFAVTGSGLILFLASLVKDPMKEQLWSSLLLSVLISVPLSTLYGG